ncbi:MAG: PAS domain S-box protein, partial [Leptospiraceae bacterium]|nr:PAS domain S-box protein [Leptospiraceae bacterium]
MPDNRHFHHDDPIIAGVILSTALSAGKMGTWSLDLKKGIFDFTEEFYNIFKTTTKEMGGNQMTPGDYAKTFIPPEYQSIVNNEIELAINSKEKNYRKTIKHPVNFADGTKGIIQVSFQVIKDEKGEITYFAGVNQDITEEENRQKEIQLKSNNLKEANERIKRLVGHISHDLRNPISGIYGLTDMVLNENLEIKKEFIFTIYNESKRALNLISGILDQSAIGLGKVELNKSFIVLAPRIKSRIESIFQIYKRDIKDLEENINIFFGSEVDIFRMEQVFDNLLSNAIKYSPENSPINIELSDAGEFLIKNK